MRTVLKPSLCKAVFVSLIALATLAAEEPDLLSKTNELLRAGQYKAAEALLESAAGQFRDAPGVRCWLLNNLGSVYDAAGDYDRAERYYRQAIAAGAERLRNGDPETLTAVANLLGLYTEYGVYGKAEQFRARMDTIAPHWRTTKHPIAGRLYSLSGVVAYGLHQYAEAEERLTHAMILYNNSMPAASTTDRSLVLNNLSAVYQATGRFEKALDAARESFRLAEPEAAVQPADFSLLLANLALLEFRAGHPEAAEQNFRRAVQISAAILPPVNPVLPSVYRMLAAYLKETGHKREAKKYVQRGDQVRTAIARESSLGQTVDYQSFRQ